MTLEIDGETLSIEDIVRVARDRQKVVLPESTREKIIRSREVIEKALKEDRTVYGVNTGFGDLASVSIGRDDLEKLQVNLIRSHAAGVGPLFHHDIVRGMMLLRANALAKGFSGIRETVVQTLLDMLNKSVIPLVPQQGSVGSSGDLAPLAHMALVLIGEGDAFYDGEMLTGKEAMKRAEIAPITLGAKEGVALINGTQPMTALGALTTYDSLNLVKDVVIAAAMSLEALRGTRTAFDQRIHQIRPHTGQIDVAKAMSSILTDSEINQSHADCGKVQDAYSLRCIPQVLGASLDTMRYAKSIIEVEINAATDNPLVFPNEGDVVSGGNFHGQPIALIMDFLGIALSELANMSERRVNRLVNPDLSGLPAFLTTESGLESGLMIAQYTAAALVSENKTLAHPASVDSIPTSADQEDHVSMGTIASRKASQILENVRNVIAIEYLCAAQGLNLLQPLQPSTALKSAHEMIRSIVPPLEEDRIISKDIHKIREIMDSGQIIEKVEQVTGPLFEI
ncbi:MAG: Histidine ammonia-lyase [Candidatus Thorarchaeota archaeon]|nr:MAG: Histidine ammonia-lyase [Candidatus Thorarchaeota archaeon]